MTRRVFTPEQDKEVAGLYLAGMSSIELAKVYSTNKTTVLKTLKRLKIDRRNNKSFTDEIEHQIISYYKDGQTVVELGDKYQVNSSTITRILLRNGVDRHANRKYVVNHNTFDLIDTEEKAYWLSFIYADGCVFPRLRLQVKLQIRDIGHLEKLRIFLGYTGPIKIRDQSLKNGKLYHNCLLVAHSSLLANTLVNLGIITGRCNFKLTRQAIPESLEHHFVRGYLDGDGSLFFTKSNDPVISFYGEEDILLWIREILHINAGTNKDKPLVQNPGVKHLTYGGKNQIARIVDYIYKDATVYLERKKEIADKTKRG